MSRQKQTSLAAIAVVLAAFIAAGPRIWRTGALYWAKISARRIFNNMKPDERRNLNATPTLIVLPDFQPGKQIIETMKIGEYLARIPKPLSSVVDTKKLRLNYLGFHVFMLSPIFLGKDTFDEWSVAYHTRLDDLDLQPDIPSIHRYLLLMAVKPSLTSVAEEFQRPDLRGFVFAPLHDRINVETFIPATGRGCGVWFIDTGGLKMNDVHEFIAVLHFDKMESDAVGLPTTAPATTASSNPSDRH